MDGLEKKCCELSLDVMRRRTREIEVQNVDVKINRDDVVIDNSKELGRGGFARVYRGTFRGTQIVAVKVLSDTTPARASIVLLPYYFCHAKRLIGTGRRGKRLERSEASQYPSVHRILHNFGLILYGVCVESERKCSRFFT